MIFLRLSYGFPMHVLWFSYGKLRGNTGKHSKSLEALTLQQVVKKTITNTSYDLPMVFLYMAFLCYSYGFPMESLGEIQGSIAIHWNKNTLQQVIQNHIKKTSCELTMAFLWLSYAFPMVFLWKDWGKHREAQGNIAKHWKNYIIVGDKEICKENNL